MVRKISKRRRAREARDSGWRRGPVGQRVKEGTGMAEAPVATPARLLLLLLGQQGHKAMGARMRRQKRGGAPVAQGQEQRRHPDGLSGWTRGGGDGEDREALDRARWRARGSGGCRWRAMVGEGWIPRGIWWSGGAAGRMGQVPRF